MTLSDRFDWRHVAVWTGLLAISLFAHTQTEVANAAHRGADVTWSRHFTLELTSHLVVGALLPAIYLLHRRWPLAGGWRHLALHAAAMLPFTLLHTLGMAALRLLWFNAVLGEAYSFPVTLGRLGYEFAKDIVNYGMLSAGVMAMRHVFARAAAVAPAPSAARPERFAVRRRDREIMVEVADIDWIEAAGNYAILHVGGERLEIRSSLSRLETELDPTRFVRVHKSHLVNVTRVVEVTPWMSGDWRIKLKDGAELNLSRRYRARFEAAVPVRS
ncbi:MAG: LytTR family transcriptional regulator [Alphaproteobacteria bacterium]|nr:LytTR family transcriptional regulator [Alphaproteobacteria bacterium]